MSFFLQVNKLLCVKLREENGVYHFTVTISFVDGATTQDYAFAVDVVNRACFDVRNIAIVRNKYEALHGIVWSFDHLVAIQRDGIPRDESKFYLSPNLWKSAVSQPTDQSEIHCRWDSNVAKIVLEAMAIDYLHKRKSIFFVWATEDTDEMEKILDVFLDEKKSF